MATADTPAASLTMKLHVDTTTRRVAFAETTKAAVDYLHSLLEPPHQVVSLDDATLAGCVHNLYNSVDELAAAARAALWPSPPDVVQQAKRFFDCGDSRGRPACGGYVTETRGAVCPSCGRQMATEVPHGAAGASCSGAGAASAGSAPPVTCVLMEDLRVMPMDGDSLAMIGTMTTMLLRNVATVREITVQLGYTEGVAILEASLRSRTALSDVFLREKAPIVPAMLQVDRTCCHCHKCEMRGLNN